MNRGEVLLEMKLLQMRQKGSTVLVDVRFRGNARWLPFKRLSLNKAKNKCVGLVRPSKHPSENNNVS